MRILKISLLLLIALSVSGCGFKLRGELNKNLEGQRVYIITEDNYQPIVLDLNRQLNRLGAVVFTELEPDTTDSKQNTAIALFLGKVREQRRILSVDDTGRSLEYEFSVELDVLIKAASSINKETEGDSGTPSTILIRRVLVYDNNQLLAKSRERDKVRKEMQRVLVEQLVERLRAQTL